MKLKTEQNRTHRFNVLTSEFTLVALVLVFGHTNAMEGRIELLRVPVLLMLFVDIENIICGSNNGENR